MKIWVTRHGQTDLNKGKFMQGRMNIPINDTGRQQAIDAKARLDSEGVHFDAVFSSPLIRAVETASIIGGIDQSEVITDDRIIEVDFGKYEGRSYYKLGIPMTLYWTTPEVFPCPKTVENIASMVARSTDFLNDLKTKDYDNVLIVCHGGIIRAICGVLEHAPKGIRWRPKPTNCEMRTYEI